MEKVKIEKLIYGGDGLARSENNKIVFIPHVLPNELVVCQTIEEKKDFLRSQIIEIIETSPLRVEPQCKHFYTCGGCHWQYIHINAQRDFKKEIVQEMLHRQTKHTIPDIIVEKKIQSKEGWHYRHNVKFQVLQNDRGHNLLGFYDKEGKKIEPIEICSILHPVLQKAFDDIRSYYHDTYSSSAMYLKKGDSDAVLCSDEKVYRFFLARNDNLIQWLSPRSHIEYTMNDVTLFVGAKDFMQANLAENQAMVSLIGKILFAQSSKRVFDLYCGNGNLSLPWHSILKSIVGIDNSESAIFCANKSGDSIGAKHANYFKVKNRREFEYAVQQNVSKSDTMIIDPPRSGMQFQTDILKDSKLNSIIYVSCNPSTFARDAKKLLSLGFSLASITLFDMFPHTYHIELIAHFGR